MREYDQNTVMRTLFLNTHVPFPLNAGGDMRSYHLLKALGAISEVTLLCSTRRSHYLEAVRPFCRAVCTFPCESWAWAKDSRLPRLSRTIKTALQYCDPLEPILLKQCKSREASQLVERLCQDDFDVVWVERIGLMNLLPRRLQARVIVDLDDLEHRKLEYKIKNTEFSRGRVFEWLEYVKLRRLYRSLESLPYEFAVCSEADKRILGGGPRIWVVPNGCEVPHPVRTEEAEPIAPIFLFVGAMSYEANVDAVLYFANEILPGIRLKVPETVFIIAGKDPVPAVKRLHDGKSVLVTGTVESMEPYWQEAAVVVVPLRYGGGTKLKILEALAHCKPVVTTTVGAEGLDVQDGEHVLMADTPSEFTRACLSLLHDRALRQRLTACGYDLVAAKYDWRNIERQVQSLVLGGASAYVDSGEERPEPMRMVLS